MPIWLTLWQIGEAYSFNGISPREQFSAKNGLVVGLFLFLAGGSLLLSSLFTLIGHFSVITAFAFLLTSFGGIVLTVWHHNVVRSEADSGSNGSGV